MKEKFAKFMAGRYGNDQLGMFMLISGLILIVLSSLLKSSFIGTVFSLLAVADLVFSYFRMFSRNVYRRQAENEKFLSLKYRATAKLRLLKESWIQRKDYKFFSCPSCRTVLRVPRGRGKIKIVCTKCGNSFIGKS